MKHRIVFVVLAVVAAVILVSALLIRARLERDLAAAAQRAAQGSMLVDTRCGPIEAQQAGEALVQQGVRVIAMSRFGYLRTPRPADASPEAHICLLDALGIDKAAVMGVSAGGPSAIQAAIRPPSRVSALVLVVPIAFKPGKSRMPRGFAAAIGQ